MQNYNWDLKTQFVFPEEYGIVEDVVSVDIKPRFQLLETEESLRLVGIYHITSTVRFDPYELPEYSEGTLIEHIELNGNNGYFEYALPLEVNFPKDKVPVGCHPEVYVEGIHYDVIDGSCASFNWDVSCIISEPFVEPVNEVDPTIQFDAAHLESNNMSLEIPSDSAFKNLIQDSETDKREEFLVAEDVEEHATIEEGVQELVENSDAESLLVDDAINAEPEAIVEREPIIELEPIVQSSNMIVPEQDVLAGEVEQETSQVDDVEEPLSADFIQTENELPTEEYVDRAFDDDDFFASLGESYTLLDVKSNKVSPE